MNANKPPLLYRLLGTVIAVLMLVGFAITLIGAGCGVGPLGLLLVAGSLDAWGLEMVTGWLGYGATILSMFGPPSKMRRMWAGIGLAGLAASFCLFLRQAHGIDFTLITGSVFLASWTIRLLLFVLSFRGASISIKST